MSRLTLGDSLILDSNIVIGQETKTGATFKGYPVYCYCNTLEGKESATAASYNTLIGVTLSNIREKVALKGFLQTAPGWGGSQLPYLYTDGNGIIARHYELWYDGNTVKANLKGSGYGSDIKIVYFAYYTKTTD